MKKTKPFILICLGTFILMLVGFYNGYPLVYSDTGTYILSGFKKFIPTDRPVTYGLFISLFDFDYSLWFVILFQNIITAYVIFETLRTLRITRNFEFFYLSIILFLTLFTGIGWYTNQVMPDYFAPLTALTIFILTNKENISKSSAIAISIILIYSMISHLSHLLIGSVLIVSVILIKYFSKRFLFHVRFKRLFIVAAITLSSWIILPIINTIIEGKFIVSKGSHVMFMAHLNHTGILKQFLDEYCSEEEFQDCKLCKYKDDLPRDLASFIWSDQQILQKCGGWTNSKDEFNKIISATLTKPKYLFMNIYKSTTYGLIQLTDNRIGYGLGGYNEGSAPYSMVQEKFPHELNDYLNSRENLYNGIKLKIDTLNIVHLILIFLSLFFVLYISTTPLRSKINSDTLTFLIFVAIAIIINSFITAGLNAPYGRFQARVVWLLPFALITLVYNNWHVIVKHRS